MPTTYKVEIAQSAENDIEEIWTYISQDSPDNAAKFIRNLEKQVETLARFPLRCPLIPENKTLGTSYRHLLFGRYRTIFRLSGRTVYVMRIFHGSKLLDMPVKTPSDIP